LLKKQFV
jgi:hypothetical protein